MYHFPLSITVNPATKIIFSRFSDMDSQDARIIDANWFNILLALVIAGNMVSIGVETDMSCVGCDDSGNGSWFIINSFFASVYVVEFSLKVYYCGWKTITSLSNLVDSMLVALAVINTWVLYFIFRSGSVRTLSMLRIVRVVRLSRMLKFMTHQTELRLLIQSFHDIHKVLFPMISFGSCVIYLSALIIRGLFDMDSLLTVYPSYSRWSGSDYWGSLPQAMLTMFQLATGDNWAAEIVRPIVNNNPWYAVFFLPYIVIMTFAFKFAIIAKLCDQIIESGSVAANRQKNLDMKTKQLIQSLRGDFRSFQMTLESLEKFVSNQTPEKLVEISDLLNLSDTRELFDLFQIFDISNTNCVSTDEYFASLTRLSGHALGKHVTWIQIEANSLASRSVEILARIAKLEARLHHVFREQLDEIFPSHIRMNHSRIFCDES